MEGKQKRAAVPAVGLLKRFIFKAHEENYEIYMNTEDTMNDLQRLPTRKKNSAVLYIQLVRALPARSLKNISRAKPRGGLQTISSGWQQPQRRTKSCHEIRSTSD